ncbi:hypothetical protein [uncultured Tateyamaria sp.]|uniref:hypothetical protein n=1 Tax=uncultured Tateyamaria sp. TaxID=455651 RepID=UPI00261E1BE4|nr:hypothetical protein [uncultured Tateyamaria sp.]
MERIWGLLACAGLCVQAAIAWGEALPMAARGSLLTERAPLYVQTAVNAPSSPSLFAGKSGTSLFRPMPVSLKAPPSFGSIPTPGVGPLGELRSLIARAEAGKKGYDAVQYGADILPAAPPTAMTIQEIYNWIDATPGQPHAIGRYQFIPPTLRRLVKRLGISPEARFSPRVQDQLADLLLKEAGLHRFLSGEMERQAFMNNLAKIWAGLPNDTGKSHYHGYAGNKATMTWAFFDAQMARIFPG